MKISIIAHPKSKKIEVIKRGKAQYEVWVREAPDKGRANEAVVRAMSDHLGVAKSKIRILRGATSRHKLLEVDI